MKKHYYQFVLVVIALFLPACTYAQKNPTIDEAIRMTKGGRFLDTNYKVTKPLSAVVFDGKPQKADKNNHKVTFEVINFGSDGNTVIITMDYGKDGVYSLSYSGKNLHVVPSYYEGKIGILAVLRGNHTDCASLAVAEGNWMLSLNGGKKTYAISSFKKGMTRAEVEDALSDIGLSQFKFTRNSGNLKVYSLFWLDMKKQWNFLGTDYKYQLRNDKRYGDFYFDAQGKLVKWILFFG